MNQRTSSEIERDIAQTRSEMSETIDAIQERLSPGQLVEQALHYFSSGGGRGLADGANTFAANLGRTMRDNPVPVALVATGLTWLMVSHNRRRPAYALYEDEDLYYDDEAQLTRYGSTEELAARYEERMAQREGSATPPAESAFSGHYGSAPGSSGTPRGEPASADPTARRPGVSGSTVGAAAVNPGGTPGGEDREHEGRGREAADQARARASRAAQDARRQAAHVGGAARAQAGGARARVEKAAGEARDRMRHASERTRYDPRRGAWKVRRQADRARSGFASLLEERPLVVGLIGVAIGAALGAMLPRTRREDEWLGETRDDLARRARAELGKAERVAEHAVDTARAEAEERELTPEGARRAAGETVREAEQAAQERLQEAAREAEHRAEDKAKDVGERLREVGEATREAAKDEAKRQDLGSGRSRNP